MYCNIIINNNIKMINIRLNASELAIITGHNKYQSIDAIKEKILIRNNLKLGVIPLNTVHKELLNIKNQKIIEKLKRNLSLSNNCSLEKVVSTLKQKYIDPSSNTDTEKESHTILENLLNKSPDIKNILEKSLYKDLIKNKGNKNESKSLNKHELAVNIRITHRNDTLYKKTLYVGDKYTIIIQGKIDGMIGGDTVVESKNRSKRLFYRIPNYEKVQLEAYLYLTNTNRALHIENYNEHSVETYYNSDMEFWSDCKKTIIEFVDKFDIK